MSDDTRTRIVSQDPVTYLPSDDREAMPPEGIGLCLSGGGYRAMLFALGSLIRLNELGVLPKLRRISSVSGGSITSAYLGLRWKDLVFEAGVAQNFTEAVVDPIRRLASTTIDLPSITGGIFLPGSVSDWIAGKYAKHLFGTATLQDLPDDRSGPRFVINATNVQTGSLWRFSRPFMADWQVGRVLNPDVRLADAVAASSAFPPVLSPAVLEIKEDSFEPDPSLPLQKPPYTTRVVLSDGGVYDNLGMETVWKSFRTVLVCDAGAKIPPQESPKEDWANHAYRVFDLVDNQVRCLRKRQLIDSYKRNERSGTYWGIRTDIADYHLDDSLPAPHERTLELAATPTRLKKIPDDLQEKIINWAYAVCDAAMRKHCTSLVPSAPAPRYPYSGSVP